MVTPPPPHHYAPPVLAPKLQPSSGPRSDAFLANARAHTLNGRKGFTSQQVHCTCACRLRTGAPSRCPSRCGSRPSLHLQLDVEQQALTKYPRYIPTQLFKVYVLEIVFFNDPHLRPCNKLQDPRILGACAPCPGVHLFDRLSRSAFPAHPRPIH